MNEPGSKKPNLYQLMCDVSSRFFELSGYPPRSMDEVADIEMSDSERLFCEKFSELWDSMEWMERSHPDTYSKEEYYHGQPPTLQRISRSDYKLVGQEAAWIETPNGLVSIYYEERGAPAPATIVRIYESSESDFPVSDFTLLGVSKQ